MSNMSKKEQKLTVNGIVSESLPNAFFRVNISEQIVLATISGKIRKNNIKILVGDEVTVEISPYDLTRGRIISRINKKKS